MKPFLLFFAVWCATLFAGCSVEIDATQAVASVASAKEVEGDPHASSARPDRAGVWVAVKALIRREAVEQIVYWQVYPHVYIVDCSSGLVTNVGTDPDLEGFQFDNFNAVRGALNKHPTTQVFELRSLIFARPNDFQMPQCLQFRGGSYTGQKIVETRTPIRVVGRLL
ncbi:hypothetical protein [Blastomonas aquatica]|uniref:hypothetical protein n=1 Tax=Blastomonas aquatica TaxID=1510276 RepID=UPI001664A293|nr:hypothetical protein [Blastomonas aquatica]